MVLDEKRMEPSAGHFYHFVITEYDRRGQMKKSMYLSEGKNISAFLCNRKVPITQKAFRAGCDQMHMEYDCLWQSASGAQSESSPLRIEGFREFEADLFAWF